MIHEASRWVLPGPSTGVLSKDDEPWGDRVNHLDDLQSFIFPDVMCNDLSESRRRNNVQRFRNDKREVALWSVVEQPEVTLNTPC